MSLRRFVLLLLSACWYSPLQAQEAQLFQRLGLRTGTQILAVAFSPDGTRIATGGMSKQLQLWDSYDGRQIWSATLIGNADRILDLAFSPDGRRIVTANRDVVGRRETVQVWDARSGLEAVRLDSPLPGNGVSVQFHPDGREIAAAVWDHEYPRYTMQIWDADRGFVNSTNLGFSRIAYSDTGRDLAAAADNGIRVWDTKSKRTVCDLSTRESVNHLSFSPGGSSIAVGCRDGSLSLLGISSRREQWSVKAHQEVVTRVEFLDRERILSVSVDGVLRISEARSGRALLTHQFPEGINGLSVARDGRIAIGANDSLRVFSERPGAGAPASAPPPPSIDRLSVRATSLLQEVEAQGRELVRVDDGRADEGVISKRSLGRFEAGWEYSVQGISSVADLNLILYDSAGNPVTRDPDVGPEPVIVVTPTVDQSFEVAVLLGSHIRGPADWKLLVHRRPAAPTLWVNSAHEWTPGREAYLYRSDLKYVGWDPEARSLLSAAQLPDESNSPGLSSFRHLITAAFRWDGHVFYALSDGRWIIYEIASNRVADPAQTLDSNAPLSPYSGQIEAALRWTGDYAYFFLTDGRYIKFDLAENVIEPGYPRSVDERSWPGLGRYRGSIQAALKWNDELAIFFVDHGKYIVYSIPDDCALPGYPRVVDENTWPGLLR